jgi:parvulin-like peptidyl-prolyl isomerase
VTHRAARLVVAALFALSARAGTAQQPAPGRSDPYAPQYQSAAVNSGAADGRYPLPQQSFAQPNNQPPPNAQSPPPAVNQTLRYPLPRPGSVAPPPTPPARAPATTASAVSAAPPALPPQAVLFAPGQIVARVGDKTILYCDVAPTVDLILAPYIAKTKSQAERDAMEANREPLTKSVIQQAVQNKMLLMEFERTMPNELRNDAKKRAESEAKLRKQINKAFENSLSNVREKVATASQEDIDKMMRSDPTVVRLAILMKDRRLESPGELDAALREFGTTLQQQVNDFGEYMMGIEAARNNMGIGKGPKKEVTHQEMLDYYQAHVADYQVPAKARFEILTARLARNGGDRQATRDLVASMGNEVLFGGTPFPAVARKLSQEPNASEGGYYDWVTPGSLASKPIDQAIFTIEVDKLSQIIEDETGFHIIRVIERQDAGQISFVEAQPEIRKAIENQRRAAEQQKYLVELRARTKVWTIYDPPADGAPPALRR